MMSMVESQTWFSLYSPLRRASYLFTSHPRNTVEGHWLDSELWIVNSNIVDIVDVVVKTHFETHAEQDVKSKIGC